MRAKHGAPIVFLLQQLHVEGGENMSSSPFVLPSEVLRQNSSQSLPLKKAPFHPIFQQAFCVNETNVPSSFPEGHQGKRPVSAYADPVPNQASHPLALPLLRITQKSLSSSQPHLASHQRIQSEERLQLASSAPSESYLDGYGGDVGESWGNEQIKVVVAAPVSEDKSKGWSTWLTPSGSKPRVEKRDLNVFAPSTL